MGLGEATQNPKLIEVGADELTRITGQKPMTRRARKSIAQFKLREGVAVGTMVTLRRQRMYEFLDRLIAIALPRVRDFRGISPKGFDGRGNYTMGLRDQLIFLEIDYMKVDQARGMNISVVTTARTDEEGPEAAAAVGHALPGELAMSTTAKKVKELKAAEVQGASAEPLQAVRSSAGVPAQVRAVSTVLSGSSPSRATWPGSPRAAGSGRAEGRRRAGGPRFARWVSEIGELCLIRSLTC